MTTNAYSKLIFIDGIKQAQGIIKDTIIVLDREQGGTKVLKEKGVTLHSLITLRELVDYMLSKGLITQEKYDEVITYLENANN